MAPSDIHVLRDLAADWAWMIDLEEYTVIDVSPFGDLLLSDRTGALVLLDVNGGCLEEGAVASDDPAVVFPIAFDDRIAKGYREAQLFLKPGTCYGYKVPCVTGGSLLPENVFIATLTEYVSFMGQFHLQIKDVEDGERVQIRVVWPKLQ